MLLLLNLLLLLSLLLFMLKTEYRNNIVRVWNNYILRLLSEYSSKKLILAIFSIGLFVLSKNRRISLFE